jgi:hypothetical protein
MDEKRRKRGGRRRKEGDVGGEGRNEPPFSSILDPPQLILLDNL